MVTKHTQLMTRGNKKGLWRAWLNDGFGKVSKIGYFETQKEAEESFEFFSISPTIVAQNFRKTKLDIENWNEMSRRQIKMLSEKYR